MATSRGKAESFRKDLDLAVTDLIVKLGIDKDDVIVTATVKIQDVVRYSSQTNDEDDD